MHTERIQLPQGVRSVRVATGADARAGEASASATGTPGRPMAGATASSAVPSGSAGAMPTGGPDAALGRIEELLSALRFQLDELEQRRRNSIREMQSAAVELAVAAAGELLIRAIQTHDYAVEQVVQAAIDKMGLHRPIRIKLHPDDLQLLQERMPSLTDWKLDPQCELHADPTLRRGDCRADAPDGAGVLRETATQLAELRELWLEELDDAQVERRSHDPARAGFKRFPERRETA